MKDALNFPPPSSHISKFSLVGTQNVLYFFFSFLAYDSLLILPPLALSQCYDTVPCRRDRQWVIIVARFPKAKPCAKYSRIVNSTVRVSGRERERGERTK